MFQDLTRRDFIKGAAMSFLAVNTLGILPEKVFAAENCAGRLRNLSKHLIRPSTRKNSALNLFKFTTAKAYRQFLKTKTV